MRKLLSIVIPVFNKWNFTKSALNDLMKLPSDHEIIIIDNASSDETAVELPKLIAGSPRIKYVRNEENVFHSKACNQGFSISIGEAVLFLNNDVRVRDNHAGWTKPLINACLNNAIIGPTMGQLDNNFNFVKEANEQLIGNSYIGGWCIAADKNVWSKLIIGDNQHPPFQVWNEEFPFYFNDTDLSFRARKVGVALKHINLPEIAHFGKISAAQINIPKLYKEGRTVFLKKWSK